MSDPKDKKADWTINEGESDNAVGIDYLYEPKGALLKSDGLHGDPADAEGRSEMSASLSRPTPKFTVGTGSNENAGYGDGPLVSGHPDARRGMQGTRPMEARPVAQPKKLTPDQMLAMASAMMEQTKARDATSNSLSDRDDAGNVLPSWLKRSAGR